MRSEMRKIIQITLCCALATTLAACGGGGPKVDPKAAKRVIYSSSGDCANGEVLEVEKCEIAIDDAIERHNKNSTTYSSLRKCELAAGEGRCERSVDDEYRIRLIAFLVTASEPPTGEPLYPPKEKDQAGFITSGGAPILEEKLEVAFSPSSVATYERFNKEAEALRKEKRR